MNDFLETFDRHLQYFNEGTLKLFPPAPENDIYAAEAQLGLSLSPQYKDFLRWHNGGRVIEISIKGVQLLGKKRIPSIADIVNINTTNWSHEWWPKNWLQLGTDGFGNYYVDDLSNKNAVGEYQILFVDHEALGRDGADSFFAYNYFDFLEKSLEEMIQLYSPTGKLKPKRA